jgi:hypothetical protein
VSRVSDVTAPAAPARAAGATRAPRFASTVRAIHSPLPDGTHSRIRNLGGINSCSSNKGRQ